jgi:phage tail sheath gpL-like
LDAIGSEAAEAVLRKVIKAAKAGDARSAEILLRRVWPERKGRTVEIKLPAVDAAADVPKAIGAVIAAMAAGELTPDEAATVAGVLESKRRAIETEEFDKRLAALEERVASEKAKR